MALRIDSHQHFWSLDDPWFCWPTPDLRPIYRNVGPDDLRPLLKAAGIDRTILIQVAPCVAETDRLLDIATATEFVAGVVGWVDLETEGGIADLERMSTRRGFVGVRPMMQSIPDVNWMLRPSLGPALEAVQQLGLTFDALVQPRHLSTLCAFADRYPNLRIVIDHAAKPSIREGRVGFDAWADAIEALATRPHVWCKLSGLLTEARSRASKDGIAPFVDHLLDSFGPERLMWGSDWPVVELAGTYNGWIELTRSCLAQLSIHERELIFGEVAREFYRLSPPNVGWTSS